MAAKRKAAKAVATQATTGLEAIAPSLDDQYVQLAESAIAVANTWLANCPIELEQDRWEKLRETGTKSRQTLRDLIELIRANGPVPKADALRPAIKEAIKGVGKRLSDQDGYWWATSPEAAEQLSDARERLKRLLADVFIGALRYDTGGMESGAAAIKHHEGWSGLAVSGTQSIGPVLAEAAKVYDRSAFPGPAKYDRRPSAPTFEGGRLMMHAALLAHDALPLDPHGYAKYVGIRSEVTIGPRRVYCPSGIPQRIVPPIITSIGTTEEKKNTLSQMRRLIETLWRLAMDEVPRDTGRDELRRLAGLFGETSLAEPSGTPPILLTAHARVRVDEADDGERPGGSMEDLHNRASRLITENPWIREPLRAAAAWALEKYAKSEELKRGNTHRVLELCRALLARGRIRDPNLSHTPSEWLGQVILWQMPAPIAAFLGARTPFCSFTKDEEQRIAPELLAALNAHEAWDRLSKAEQKAESERFLASPEAQAMKRVWWEVFIAKPEDWVEPSFLLSLDPDTQGTMPERERVAIWLVALGGLFDSAASDPIVPRPTGSEHEVFLGNVCWDGRCIRIDPKKTSPSGLWYEGATPFRMSELVMFLEKWVREGAVPEGWGRREGEEQSKVKDSTRRKPRARRVPPRFTDVERKTIEVVSHHHQNFSAAAKELGRDPKTVRENYTRGMAKAKKQGLLKEGSSRSVRARQTLPTDKRGNESVSGDDDDV